MAEQLADVLADAGESVFAFRAFAPPDAAQTERVEALVRDRFRLAPRDLVLVREEPGRLPGLPARLTTILFWPGTGPGSGARHRVVVFRPVREVTGDDLPQSWLRSALLDEGEGDCC